MTPRPSRPLIALIGALAAALATLAPGAAVASETNPTPLEHSVALASPGIVFIATSATVHVRLKLSDEPAEGTFSTDYATGSGFTVNPTGTIVTASHVVEPASDDMHAFAANKLFVDKLGLITLPSGGSYFDTYTVTDNSNYNHRLHQCYEGVICEFETTPSVSVYTPADLADGRASNPLDARVLKSTGFDKTDIAVLQVAGTNMPTVALARSVANINPGQPVTAIGFAGTAQNLPSNGEPDLKDGAASNVRTVGSDKQLEIDVEIEEGMSGGPVINRSAGVVGVTSYYIPRSSGESGTKFARSVDDVREVMTDVGKKAFRGEADTAYAEAMDLFWDKHYKDAIPVFDKVLLLSEGQPFAKKYRARSEALIDQSVPLDSGGFPWWAYIVIALGVFAALGLVGGVLATRRRKETASAPAAAPPPPASAAVPPPPVVPFIPPAPARAPHPAPTPAVPPPDPPALVFKAGPRAGKRVQVRHELILGRENVDVLIEDPQVSRRHASVRAVDGRLEIADLGSSNGTYVNGVRLRETSVLENGDEIRIGSVALQVDVPARVRATVVAHDPKATVVGSDGPPEPNEPE